MKYSWRSWSELIFTSAQVPLHLVHSVGQRERFHKIINHSIIPYITNVLVSMYGQVTGIIPEFIKIQVVTYQ